MYIICVGTNKIVSLFNTKVPLVSLVYNGSQVTCLRLHDPEVEG